MNEKPQHSINCKFLSADGLKFQTGSLNITVDGLTCNLESPETGLLARVEKSELSALLDKIKEVDRPSGLIPAENGSTDKFPFQAIPETALAAKDDPEVTNPVVNVSLRTLIEAESNKYHSHEEFKNAVIALVDNHIKNLAPAMNSGVKTLPLGDEKIEGKAWQDFYDTGLPLLINQTLHAFGWALVFFNDKGEGFDCLPARVKYRGFDDAAAVTEAYGKIAKYVSGNADQLLKEATE